MSESSSMNQIPNPFEAKDIGGIFYPVDYLVAAFPNPEDAQHVCQGLMNKGFNEATCLSQTGEEMSIFLEKNLSENNGFLAKLGKSDDAVKVHLDAAKKGAAFLLVYAPEDEAAMNALEVLRSKPFDFIHRYHRLAIEEIQKKNQPDASSITAGTGSPASGA